MEQLMYAYVRDVCHAMPWCRWEAIQSSGELRRMSRMHIHFATQPHHMRNNSWASVLLKLKLGVSGPLACLSVRRHEATSMCAV